MTIRTKLQLSSIGTASAIALFVFSVLFLVFTLRHAYEKQQLAQQITETSFQLALLQGDYLTHPNERAKNQWIDTYETQSRLLDGVEPLFVESSEKKILEEVRGASNQSRELFGQLVKAAEEGGSQTVIEELNTQLTVRGQERVSGVLQLSQLSRAASLAAESQLELIAALLVILVAALSFWSYIISRSIATSLKVLEEGAQAIAKGNLDYKLETTGHDEFSAFAALFNIMSGKVRDSYSTLEQKVSERTTSLSQKVAELETVKKETLTILEDLKSEQKHLAEAKAKDDAILSSIGEGLIVTDKEGRIVFVNAVFEELLELNREEVQGKPLVEVLSMFGTDNKLIPASERLVTMTLLAGRKISTGADEALFYKRKDGSLFPIAVTVSPVTVNGQIVGAVEVFRDITREKEIDKAKSEFVSLASHQLRTPLSTINWYAEMLIAGDAGLLSGEQKKYVEEIYRGNHRMVDLVNALLNVSRLELGTFAIDPVPTDLIAIAKDVVLEIEPKVFERKIDLQEAYDKHMPTVNVDPNLMRILFQNLVSNAVKYTPPEGKVVLRVDVAEGKNAEKNIQITVADTGYGIPKDAQGKIFTKLYRADNVRMRETDGTGLGLYIIKSILEKTGGEISFVSEENKGTTFTVLLPLTGMQKREGSRTLST